MSAELVLIPALNLLGKPVSALDRATAMLPPLADHPAFNEYMVGQLETAVPTGHRYAGDLDRAEEAALRVYERVTQQGAGLLRGVYALRLGQIALWRGALARAEQYFLEAVMALDGDAMTRASAVDHVRYTRALTVRSDMPSALAPNALYAVEHGFLSSGRRGGGGRRLLRPGARPRRGPAGDQHGPSLQRDLRPLRGGPPRRRARGRRDARPRCRPSRDGCCRPSSPPSRRWPNATATGWRRSAADWRSWAASCTPPS